MRSSSPVLLALLLVACGSNSGSKAGSSQTAPSTPTLGAQGAARLLTQGTFGPTDDSIQSTATQSYDRWFAAQAAATPTLTLSQVPEANSDRLVPWWTAAVKGPDQLRQRVAFALSQIFVVSNAGSVLNAQGVASYSDLMVTHALGNFRDLLDAVSHSPVMGQYLSFFKNDKSNPATGSHADENYAREVMQLFTVGLVKLNPDDSEQRDAQGHPLPTYGQPDVENLARVFTGGASAPVPPHTGESAWLYDNDDLHPTLASWFGVAAPDLPSLFPNLQNFTQSNLGFLAG